jgi:amino acid transporter
LAPVGLFLVTVMLFFFRRVYSEVVTAIPVNGGTYNVMLNTTTKKMAAFVGCLSILAYVATAIVSAFDSVVYLSLLWPEVGKSLLFSVFLFKSLLIFSFKTPDVRAFTIIILGAFGAVTICGVGESASVAMVMFVTHVILLTVLIIWGFIYGCQDNFTIFVANLNAPYPDIVTSTGEVLAKNSAGMALYFGYCSALLGEILIVIF